ncbi:MAG: ABC transporter permease [Alteromonadaceae bacterium]|nr:ABC transporter permease [Alteromonadaceae bacterium]
MKSITYQHKQAWASLKKKPGFIVTILVTMGITLGALLCIATLNYLLLAKPLPYPDQNKLYVGQHLLQDPAKEVKARAYTYPGLVYMYQKQTSFSKSTIVSYEQGVVTSLNSQPTVDTSATTPEMFELMNIQMSKGRGFSETEGLNAYNPVAVLSYKGWLQYFDGRQDILEQKLTISGVSYRIIGVTSKSFTEPQLLKTGRETAVWLPWDYNQTSEAVRKYWGDVSSSLFFIGKLKDGEQLRMATQVLTDLVDVRWQQEGIATGWSIRIDLIQMKEVILGESKTMALLLLGGVLGLVLIAIANISNLFMSRTVEQQGSMSIHAALGAKKSDLFNAMFAETLQLMVMSVIIGLIIASAGFYVLQTYLIDVLPRANELSVNVFTLGVAVLVALLLAWFFAKLSANLINYRQLKKDLQGSGKGTGVQVSKTKRQWLIGSQVALATVLVIANLSLFNKAMETITTPKGFELAGISQLSISTATSMPINSAQSRAVMQEIIDSLASQPQVKKISQGKSPVSGYDIWAMKEISTNERLTPLGKRIDSNYFEMIGQPLVEGRNLTADDIKGGASVMVVNEAFAKSFNKGSPVLGMKVTRGSDSVIEVVGVVKGINLPNESDQTPRVYMPERISSYHLMIQFKNENLVFTRARIAQIVSNVDSRFNIFRYEDLKSLHTKLMFAEITAAVTTSSITLLVLFLAGVGLYGILSYNIQLRQVEIATRMAIGAKQKHLYSLVIKDSSASIGWGFVGSFVIFVVLFLGFGDAVSVYINIGLLSVVPLALGMIVLLALFACSWPLRRIIKRPVILSLQ